MGIGKFCSVFFQEEMRIYAAVINCSLPSSTKRNLLWNICVVYNFLLFCLHCSAVGSILDQTVYWRIRSSNRYVLFIYKNMFAIFCVSNQKWYTDTPIWKCEEENTDMTLCYWEHNKKTFFCFETTVILFRSFHTQGRKGQNIWQNKESWNIIIARNNVIFVYTVLNGLCLCQSISSDDS